jgi:hypothetical protein
VENERERWRKERKGWRKGKRRGKQCLSLAGEQLRVKPKAAEIGAIKSDAIYLGDFENEEQYPRALYSFCLFSFLFSCLF